MYETSCGCVAGLLAGLWEFPSIEIESDCSEEHVWQQLLSDFQLPAAVQHHKLGMVIFLKVL